MSQIIDRIAHSEQLLKNYEFPTLQSLIRQHMHATIKCLGVNGSKKLRYATSGLIFRHRQGSEKGGRVRGEVENRKKSFDLNPARLAHFEVSFDEFAVLIA